jgi:uncharacterized membrane protein YkvA (DUF1232 family)
MGKTDLRLLWFALRHPLRPVWLIPATGLLILYALAPFNFVLPVIGVVDEMVIVPLVLHFLVKLLPRDIAIHARRH